MTLVDDLRAGARMLVQQPGLTAAAALALALGVGLTTLLFSITYGIYYRGMPVPDSGRIVAVTMTNVATGQPRLGVSIHDFADWRAAERTFDEFAAFRIASINVSVREGQPERLAGAFLTANGFDVVRARPLVGRAFVPADALPGAAPVLVLGHGVWSTRFGSDPGVVGRAVRANGESATIIGVMPTGFAFPEAQEAWMLLEDDPLAIPRGTGPTLIACGRLKSGTSAAQAQADLAAIAARLAREHPDTNRNLSPVVQAYTRVMSGDEDSAVAMALALGTGFGVLLIACTNVANLLFARAAGRTREVAIRTALGASRRRIVGQLLLETLALSALGTAGGLALAYVGVGLFNRAIVDTNPPFWIDIRLDAMPLILAVGLTGVAALGSGLVPALRASRGDVNEVLKDGTRSTGGLRIGRMSRALVAAEIVLSFALLVTAGLMIRSLVNLGTQEYGFPTDDVFTARIVLPETAYSDGASRAQFLAALQERLAALPGIRSAALASNPPGLQAERVAVAIEHVAYADGSHYPIVRSASIAPGFFATFDQRVLRGRDFGPADDAAAPRVAIINASFAGRYFVGENPIGRRVRLGRNDTSPWVTVVGIAPDLCMAGAENRDPAGVYVPIAQTPARTVAMVLRGPGASPNLTASVRAQVGALDRDLPVYFPKMLRRAIDDSMWAYRVFSPLLVVVGLAALFLATAGLASLMAFAARQRTREIGLRMALGARPADIARLVVGEVGTQIGVGLMGGAVLAAWLASAMRNMVFRVQPHDPVIYAAIVLTLVGAAALAALVPVRRAVRVDPTVTLRDP